MPMNSHDGYPPPDTPHYIPTSGYLASVRGNPSAQRVKNYNVWSAFAIAVQQFCLYISGLTLFLPAMMGVPLFNVEDPKIASPGEIAPLIPEMDLTSEAWVILGAFGFFVFASLVALAFAFIYSIIGLVASSAYKVVGLMVMIASGLNIAGIIFFVINIADLYTKLPVTF